MAEQPFTPPTRKPVSEFPTPDPSVAFYTELVNRDDPAYMANSPVKRGQLYANMVGAKREVIENYPALFFLEEQKYQLNDQLVLWHWATDENANDTYNAEINYAANARDYPTFTRTYTVRRELWEADPTIPVGSPLPGIIAVEITSPGQNHTTARGVIDGTSVAIEFTVSTTGGLINGIITNTGSEQIPNGTAITIIGDGQDSSAIAVSQPIGCVLVAQKKEELPADDPTQHEMVRLTRTYETLPGPWIYSTRIDKDGMLVTLKTRRQVAAFITDKDEILGGEWIQTWHKETDDFVAEENIESRPLPGNPIYSTDVEPDGIVKTTTKTLVDCSTIVSGETLVLGIWTKTRKEEIASTTFIKDTQASNKVCWQVAEARAIPGNPMVDTKVDKDGVPRDIVKTLKDTTLIVEGEVISGGNVWITTEKEAVSDLVANEIVTARILPGNYIPSASVDQDHEVSTINTRLRPESAIVPEATESGGFITTVEKREVTDLVSDEITTVKRFLDAASYSISIINLIPREFMAFIPTFTESHVVAGTATMPALGLGEFEHSRKQLTKLLFEDRVTSLGPISLPITHTNQELTEQFGGGVLNVTLTLDVTGAQTIDQGYLVTRSTLNVLGNGMDVKETAQLDGTEWPTLTGTGWDQDMQIEFPFEEQVVPTTYVVNIGAFILETLDPIDDWRSKRKLVTKVPINTETGNAMVTFKYHPFRFPGLLTFYGFGAYVRASDSQLCKHTVRTWWENSAGTPSVAVDEIIMDDPIINTLNDVTALAYSGPCLHDTFTAFGVITFLATTPSYTEYTGTWQGNEKIIAGSVDKTDIPNLWKIQTISVTMR